MQTRAVELEARETDWEYAPGHRLRGMGFNGSIPGPLIEAEVGDTIRARLTNNLAEPTTIHWHGLRVPAAMDGTASVQPVVEPGESFDYEFTVPDAGTFWYHSHVNETEQLERGLYGPLVVRGPGEPTLDADRVLMLDDLKLDRRRTALAVRRRPRAARGHARATSASSTARRSRSSRSRAARSSAGGS